MELRFAKFDPSGNTTILILDKLPRDRYAEISVKVMAETSLCAEQVGFLEEASDPKALGRLQMMGGEFCGNASRSFAAWIALDGLRGLKPVKFNDNEKSVNIEVSGHQGILTANVSKCRNDYTCFSEVEMPLPLDIIHDRNDQLDDYSIVVFEGIVHVILWNKNESSVYVDIIRDLLVKTGLSTECFGVMFYDNNTSKMIPVVYVSAVGSLVWESSCGSGTVAVASALAHKSGSSIDQMRIHQPGGDLFAKIEVEKGIKRARLSGEISVTAVGTLYID